MMRGLCMIGRYELNNPVTGCVAYQEFSRSICPHNLCEMLIGFACVQGETDMLHKTMERRRKHERRREKQNK